MKIEALAGLTSIPDFKEKKYLLAISGGVDSVVLAHLMVKNKLTFELAHCNFKLRGIESDMDEHFIKELSTELNVPLHLKECPVNKNQNTQLSAREMRYEWFRELHKKFDFDYILTAHHLNDAIETFFINLLRGTGITGLTGIPENEVYLRPLLNIKREEILKYANKHHLKWREDSSNSSLKYVRNQIRHNLVPAIKDLNPLFEESMRKTFSHLKETNSILEDWFEEKKEKLITRQKDDEILNIDKWKKINNKNAFLYQWLSPYHFSDWDSIYKLYLAQTGKKIETDKHLLFKHGNKLILSSKSKNIYEDVYTYQSIPSRIDQPVSLIFSIHNKDEVPFDAIKSGDNKTVFIDFDKITFPVIIRKRKDGDFFYPLGMKGKKKISDFFKDEKIPLPEKEKNWLFCDSNNIIWILGKRLDDRYKINEKTKKILKIEML